jgi:hypothetical protein
MTYPLRAPRWLVQTASLALIGALTTGCYTTTLISPLEVPRLALTPPLLADDGHDLHDLEGNAVNVGKTFSVKIEPRPGLPDEWVKWAATTPPIRSPIDVEVRGPMLMIKGDRDPKPTEVPLAYVQRVRVREYSHGKTAGLVVGLTVGTLLTVAGTFLIAIMSTGNGFGK